MTLHRTRSTSVYVVLLLTALSRTCAAQFIEPPAFRGLGGLQGSGSYRGGATAVSGDGRVVVGFSGAGGSGNRAVRYENGELSVLNGAPPGFFLRDAFGVSHDGSVVVGLGIPDGGQTEAFLWDNGVVTRLGDLQNGVPRSVANAVSADGLIVVGNGYGLGGRVEAFRWENGIMEGLGVLLDSTASDAYDISADGRVIVGRSTLSVGPWAFRWENGQMEPLAATNETRWTVACGVSSNGSVIAGAMQDMNFNYHLVRWVQGNMEILAAVGNGNLGRCSVSSDGSTITWRTGHIWNIDYGLVDLRDHLTMTLGLNLSVWELGEPRSISLDGLTIVGAGDPPECGGCSEIFSEGWIAFLGRTEPVTDADGDGVVDGVDLCPATIVGVFVDPTGCPLRVPGDFDRDGDVDLIDYAIWQRCMSGADEPADPACKTQP